MPDEKFPARLALSHFSTIVQARTQPHSFPAWSYVREQFLALLDVRTSLSDGQVVHEYLKNTCWDRQMNGP